MLPPLLVVLGGISGGLGAPQRNVHHHCRYHLHPALPHRRCYHLSQRSRQELTTYHCRLLLRIHSSLKITNWSGLIPSALADQNMKWFFARNDSTRMRVIAHMM
jgi:hypothetical protein